MVFFESKEWDQTGAFYLIRKYWWSKVSAHVCSSIDDFSSKPIFSYIFWVIIPKCSGYVLGIKERFHRPEFWLRPLNQKYGIFKFSDPKKYSKIKAFWFEIAIISVWRPNSINQNSDRWKHFFNDTSSEQIEKSLSVLSSHNLLLAAYDMIWQLNVFRAQAHNIPWIWLPKLPSSLHWALTIGQRTTIVEVNS